MSKAMSLVDDRGREEFGRIPGRALVFTATYNEGANIEEFCRKVLSLDEDLDLLVVDDSSPDGTGEILDRLERREPRLKVLHRPRKLGLGSAHKLAMLYSIQNEYDVLVTMDGDFSHDPSDIPRLLDELAGCDFVIGSRYAEGGSSDYTGYRRAVSRCANWSARVLLGIPLHEFTTSFRAFRVEALRSLDISSIRSQGYSFFLESLFRFAGTGSICREIPIHFHDRKAGKSKIPRLEIFRGMAKLLKLVLSRKRHAAPGKKPPCSPCPRCGSSYVLDPVDGEDSSRESLQSLSCLSCGEPSSLREESRERILSPS